MPSPDPLLDLFPLKTEQDAFRVSVQMTLRALEKDLQDLATNASQAKTLDLLAEQLQGAEKAVLQKLARDLYDIMGRTDKLWAEVAQARKALLHPESLVAEPDLRPTAWERLMEQDPEDMMEWYLEEGL